MHSEKLPQYTFINYFKSIPNSYSIQKNNPMPHIFLNTPAFNGDNRFFTQNAILRPTHYKPKVLIIGTYNDANNPNNNADFFYGRNYFWPVISNLSNHANLLLQRRDVGGIPPGSPTLGQILALCEKFKLSFADLILDVNLPLADHNDGHLNAALNLGQAVDNVQNIIEYINNSPSITHVYATSKFNHANINVLWQSINAGVVRNDVTFGNIRTPSGMGGIPNFPGLRKTASIARYWLWVNHPMSPYGNFSNQNGYLHLDHQWLINCGVNPVLF
jgi:hypothetical protein